MNRLVLGIILTFEFLNVVNCATILALFSSLSYSDHQVFRGYVSLLAQRGHSLVVMTPYPGHFQYPEAERIVELDVGQEAAPFWDEYKKLMTNTDDYYPRLKTINEHSLKLAIAQLRSKQMSAVLMNPSVKFDLVITEADVPLLYAVADKYRVPHISITTSSGKVHQYEAKGNLFNPTVYPDDNNLNFSNLSVWQRVGELYRQYQTRNEYYNSLLPLSELAARKILGLSRRLEDVERNIDMLFIASNPLLICSRPVVPAITFVDRLHIKTGLGLPKDLEKVLNAATKGVVYFSLGAIQEAEQLSPQILQTLSDAFCELPYTVLWKIGNTTLIKKCANVITQAWFPQQQVLGHPNVKVFITHGGPRSIEEAVVYQVPIIGLPLVKSRKAFIREVTKHGAGEILDTQYLDKDTLTGVIKQVSSNQIYKQSMKKLRNVVMDPLISGPENAVWWTEYVLRNGGARNLRTQAVGVSFAKYYMLDVLAILLIFVVIILYFSFKILHSVIQRLRGCFMKNSSNKTEKCKAL